MCLEITVVDEDGNVVEVHRSGGLREYVAWLKSLVEIDEEELDDKLDAAKDQD